MSEYRLTKRADNDLLVIFIYGIEQFGEAQAERYQHQMIDCFRLLADNPRMGRMAETIGGGVRRHEHGRHIVLYEEAPYGVLVLALVHVQNIRKLKV